MAGRIIAAVSCGAFFSLALDDTGALFWWGDLAGTSSLVPQQVKGP